LVTAQACPATSPLEAQADRAQFSLRALATVEVATT
jgi:hypothetical protein